ncbi:MAG: YicC family protein [Pirellulales bacterium]|nr:YicC family protein [Pirellulales bacterium]
MTGFGEAHRQENGTAVSVELRTINSRYLKISIRTSDGYSSLEPQIEGVVRDRVRRGTIQVGVRVDRAKSPEDYRIDTRVLDSYRHQLETMFRLWGTNQPVPIDSLLLLPGVVDEGTAGKANAAEQWPVVEKTLEEALANLERMRGEEGRVMADDLRANGRAASACLEVIQRRAPLVAEAYRGRLEERLKRVLGEVEVKFDPSDVIKEVGLFAERSDISEEIVRLRSHLEQFDTIIDAAESSGRKMEFLTQEMFREVNTIGSKANDVEISRQVIEIKAAIERIREMIQNIE